MHRCIPLLLAIAAGLAAQPAPTVSDAVILGKGASDRGYGDAIAGIELDAAGNVYVAGSTGGLDFAGGTFHIGPTGGASDAFVVKLDPTLSEVLYAVRLGGSLEEYASALEVDDHGAVYLAGFTGSPDWPPTVGEQGNSFVLKLDATGGKLEFLTKFQGGLPRTIGVDSQRRIWVGGVGRGPVTSDAIQSEIDNEYCSPRVGFVGPFPCNDGFLVRLSGDGARLEYGTAIGGNREDSVEAILAAPGGGVFVGGATDSPGFPPETVNFADSGGGFIFHLSGDASPQVLASWRTGRVKDLSTTQAGDLATSGAIPGFSFLRHVSLADYQEVRFQGYREEFGLGRLAWAADGSAVLWTPSPISGDHPRINVPAGFLSSFSQEGEVTLYSQLVSGIPNPIPAVGPDGSVYLYGETSLPFLGSAANAARTSILGDGDQGVAILRAAPMAKEEPLIYRVDNAAGLSDPTWREGLSIAPGEILTIRGRGLGPREGVAGLSTELGGVRVLFDEVPAHLLWVEAGQINLIAPWGLRPQCVGAPPNEVEGCLPRSSSRLVVERNGERFGFYDLSVTAARPGVFTESATGQGQILALNEDGSANAADNPARAGEILTLYATGLGPTQPPGMDGGVQGNERVLVTPVLPVRATIARRTAEVVLATVRPGMLHGLYEIQVRVPDDLLAPGELELHLYVGVGASQDLATVAIE